MARVRAWNISFGIKETFVCLNCTFCKIYTVCFFLKYCTWLIKADVSVSSDSEELQINTTLLKNIRIVLSAGLFRICGESVWNKSTIFIDIDMIK